MFVLCFFSDIHCMRTTNTKTFTSFLRLPQNFLSPPVLENVGSESIDPTQCLITRTNVDGIFALDLSQVSWACPVQCSPAKSVLLIHYEISTLMRGSCHIQGVEIGVKYHSRALKSRSKLKATTGLRATLRNFLLHKI